MSVYEDVILENCKFPYNFFKLVFFKYRECGFNSSCGDELTVYFNLIKKNVPIQVSFYGESCSIAKAYCSLVIKYLNKSSFIVVYPKINKVGLLFKGSGGGLLFKKDSIALVSKILKYPDRLKCGVLGFNTIDKLLQRYLLYIK